MILPNVLVLARRSSQRSHLTPKHPLFVLAAVQIHTVASVLLGTLAKIHVSTLPSIRPAHVAKLQPSYAMVVIILPVHVDPTGVMHVLRENRQTFQVHRLATPTFLPNMVVSTINNSPTYQFLVKFTNPTHHFHQLIRTPHTHSKPPQNNLYTTLKYSTTTTFPP